MAITHISLHVQNFLVSCLLMVSQLLVDLITDGVSVLFNGFNGLFNNGGFLDFTGRGKGVVDSHGGVEGGTVVSSMSIGKSSSIGSSMGKSAVDDSRVGHGQNGGENEL